MSKLMTELLQQHIEDKNTKRINIFLTKEQYAELYRIKYKYRLSLTNITKIIQSNYFVLAPVLDKCLNEQYYKTNNRKSSIKIVRQSEEKYNSAKAINNMLIIFIEKQDKKLLPQKLYEKIRNKIYNEFEQIQDPFYDYNEYVRKFVYVKKKFEQ